MHDEDPLERVQLTRRYHLHQRTRGHRTATDDVLCAWAGVRARPDARRYLDLGAGHGAVTLMVLGALPDATATAIEAQAISHALLTRNLADNGLSGRATAVLGDLRDAELPGDPRFDLITGSPPFMPVGSGPLPRDPQRAGGRFELRGGIEAYAEAAARWLAPGGVASLLMDGASRDRCERAFRDAGLALGGVTTVYPVAGKAPRYIVYRVAHGAAVTVPQGQRSGAALARPWIAAPGAAAGGGGDAAGSEARSDRGVLEDALTVRTVSGAWTEAFAAARATLDLPCPPGAR